MFTTPRVTAATSIRAQHGRVAVLKCFNFPKRQFGTKGKERSFRAEWCDTFSWLHYDVKTDAAFCYLCMRCEAKKKFLASTKGEPAFIPKGFTYWKEGPKAFKKH